MATVLSVAPSPRSWARVMRPRCRPATLATRTLRFTVDMHYVRPHRSRIRRSVARGRVTKQGARVKLLRQKRRATRGYGDHVGARDRDRGLGMRLSRQRPCARLGAERLAAEGHAAR